MSVAIDEEAGPENLFTWTKYRLLIGINPDENIELEKWCDENLTGKSYLLPAGYSSWTKEVYPATLHISNDDDFFLIKLRW